MNGVELFLLGRTLMKIGEAALPMTDTGAERTVLIVIEDIATHTHGTVSEIAQRSGLPQSAVSAAVARLDAAGAITLEVDPADRRRTLIRAADHVAERVAQVRASSVDRAIEEAVVSGQPGAAAEVIEALEVVARHLRPNEADH